MRYVPRVGEKKLKLMWTGLQRNLCLRLTGPKVQVIFIVRNGTVETWHFRIDDEVVMPGIFLFEPSRGDPHP
jgi:hypothetical protein